MAENDNEHFDIIIPCPDADFMEPDDGDEDHFEIIIPDANEEFDEDEDLEDDGMDDDDDPLNRTWIILPRRRD